jgi:phospholipid/cholesterol/gamma-HCH transport system ATP-binding protein
VIVTHELESIHLIADRILMLDLGKVVFYGTRAEALASREPRVRQFFDRKPDEFITQRNI